MIENIQNSYIRIKDYKNDNTHIELLRFPDLIENRSCRQIFFLEKNQLYLFDINLCQYVNYEILDFTPSHILYSENNCKLILVDGLNVHVFNSI